MPVGNGRLFFISENRPLFKLKIKNLEKYKNIVSLKNNYYMKKSFIIINKYLGYIDNIYKYSNYILIGSKISFLAETNFNNVWGAQYLGMNYGPSSLRMFDIKCTESTRSDLYLTMVHELAHTWDFYYSNFFNNPISDEADVMNLFTKYSNYTNKPFRTYSYSNNREFFADMMRYYYFKYLDKKSDFVNLNYPEDIKVVMEKYICIASNNYDKTKCN